MKKIRINQIGDTLVEVLLATVILSAVLATAYTLSNRATKLNQESFERTQVVGLMQKQAELVRAARDDYAINPTPSANWLKITGLDQFASGGVQALGNACNDFSLVAFTGRTTNDGFNISDLNSFRNDVVPVSEQPLYRIWAEIAKPSVNADYWNVHVFGCWEGLSSSVAHKTSIVLRLEDPS